MRSRPCLKVRYPGRLDALIALAFVGNRRHARRPKDEVRAYKCPRCHGWHLTSQAEHPHGRSYTSRHSAARK